jgi:hypothetical protein
LQFSVSAGTMRISTFVVALMFVSTSAERKKKGKEPDEDHADREGKGGGTKGKNGGKQIVSLGPRPYFLVDSMKDSDLKAKLGKSSRFVSR